MEERTKGTMHVETSACIFFRTFEVAIVSVEFLQMLLSVLSNNCLIQMVSNGCFGEIEQH